jgi:hypothetical protein
VAIIEYNTAYNKEQNTNTNIENVIIDVHAVIVALL